MSDKNNSTELERRLRELWSLYEDSVTGETRFTPQELLQRAARIGAELEREECAELAWEAMRVRGEEFYGQTIAKLVRARGGK
jgi:hypothetical protein